MTTETVEPTEIEEVNPLALIASLENDLRIAIAGLRSIVRTNPAFYSGGPSNKNFGNRYEQAFEEARSEAFDTLQRMENHPDDKDN